MKSIDMLSHFLSEWEVTVVDQRGVFVLPRPVGMCHTPVYALERPLGGPSMQSTP